MVHRAGTEQRHPGRAQRRGEREDEQRGERGRGQLPLSFVLIGFFLWVAENVATFLGAWRYPDQGDAWRMVHAGKFGSWVLLVSLSFVLVSLLDRRAAAGTTVPGAAAAERAAP